MGLCTSCELPEDHCPSDHHYPYSSNPCSPNYCYSNSYRPSDPYCSPNYCSPNYYPPNYYPSERINCEIYSGPTNYTEIKHQIPPEYQQNYSPNYSYLRNNDYPNYPDYVRPPAYNPYQ